MTEWSTGTTLNEYATKKAREAYGSDRGLEIGGATWLMEKLGMQHLSEVELSGRKTLVLVLEISNDKEKEVGT